MAGYLFRENIVNLRYHDEIQNKFTLIGARGARSTIFIIKIRVVFLKWKHVLRGIMKLMYFYGKF